MDLEQEYSKKELEKIDIELHGFEVHPWEFKRGAKTERVHMCEENNIAIRLYYTYDEIDGGRSIENPIRWHEFYNKQGEVFHSYPWKKHFNENKLEELNAEIRRGRIKYLKRAGESLVANANLLSGAIQLGLYPPELEVIAESMRTCAPIVPLIMKIYEKEIQDYMDWGSRDFEDKIRAEDNVIIAHYLDMIARPPEPEFLAGLTVRQSILYQLTGEKPPTP